MKKLQFFFYSLLLFLFIIVEIYILKNFSTDKDRMFLIVTGLGLLVVVLWSYIHFRKKNIYFLRSFLMSMKADVISVYGILLVIYFIVHMTWIPEDIKNYIKSTDPGEHNWLEIFFHLEFLLLPFLIVAIFYQEKDKKVDRIKRKVLITGVSLLPGFEFNKPNRKSLTERELGSLKTIKEEDNWVTWNPIKQALDNYPNIETVILVGSKQTKQQHDLIKADPDSKNLGLKNLILNHTPTGRKTASVKTVLPKILSDVNRIETVYNAISFDVLESGLFKSKEYEDEDILFASTGGTAIVSSAMTMHGVKGLRGIVYTRQDDRKLEEFNLSLFNFRELVNELIEKI